MGLLELLRKRRADGDGASAMGPLRETLRVPVEGIQDAQVSAPSMARAVVFRGL